MKSFKICLAALAAASLIGSPVMAQTLSPSANAVGNANVKRVAVKADGERKRRSGVVYGAIGVAALIGAIVGLSSSSNDSPASP